MPWDVFLSYAAEQRFQIANPLAAALRARGVHVWQDRDELSIGDELHDELNKGISQSRFGIAIISPEYLQKHYTMKELKALLLKEEKDGKVLLPILAGLSHEALAKDQPLLATKITAQWEGSAEDMAAEIHGIILPYITPAGGGVEPKVQAELAEYLYWYSDQYANAIRLIGGGSQHFHYDDIVCTLSSAEYVMPKEIAETRSEVLSRLIDQAQQRKQDFFDGPCARLLSAWASVANSLTEDRKLSLEFGPLGWHDYSVVREFTDNLARKGGHALVSQFIDLQRLAQTQSVTESRLSNIVDTATTLVTTDGYLLFSRRGLSVSAAAGWHTSAIAENINRHKDRWADDATEVLPLPFRAVIRGAGEELSPTIQAVFAKQPRQLICTGLSFDLHSYHPDLLFLGAVDRSLSDVISTCRHVRGKDWHEGQVRACSISDSESLRDILSVPTWTGGGKASLIRAIEYISAVAIESGTSPLAVCQSLGASLRRSR